MFIAGPSEGYIRTLTDVLLATPIEGVITYSSLSEAVGFAVQDRFYLVLSAITKANAESGSYFKNVRMVGYQRMPSAAAVRIVGKDFRARVRRGAYRAERIYKHTLDKANDLSEQDRRVAFREQASVGILRHLTYERNLPAIPAGDKPPSHSAVIRDTISALRRYRAEDAA
jgi:hypothetical protein